MWLTPITFDTVIMVRLCAWTLVEADLHHRETFVMPVKSSSERERFYLHVDCALGHLNGSGAGSVKAGRAVCP